jgi:hypothetical protein
MPHISPLSLYALSGLRRCWMPDLGRWSHKYHLDGRPHPNESVPHSDLYYSLNVLLGLAALRDTRLLKQHDPAGHFVSICEDLPRYPVRDGAWGMALWAAAELDLATPSIPAERLWRVAADPSSASAWAAQDLGLSLSGAVAQARRDAAWRPIAQTLSKLVLQLRGRGALFRDSDKGPRRHFATFATQVYAALSLYQWGELTDDSTALAAANACTTKLIALQGPLGQWPWFYSPHSDRVLDPYEIYSVHQHGMAPAVLHHAVRHGVPEARQAIVTGFQWIFGSNEMGISMMRPDLSLIYRSQRRRGVSGRREARLARAAVVAVMGGAWPSAAPALQLTEEMRSYEFGWLLWSFAGRDDYPELTERREFEPKEVGAEESQFAGGENELVEGDCRVL